MIWNKEHIYRTGESNGYPKCCIDAYYRDLIKYRSPASLRKIDQSGYIPCQKHYEEYKEKLRCLEELCKQKEENRQESKSLFRLYIDGIGHRFRNKSSANSKNISEIWKELGLLEHLIG